MEELRRHLPGVRKNPRDAESCSFHRWDVGFLLIWFTFWLGRSAAFGWLSWDIAVVFFLLAHGWVVYNGVDADTMGAAICKPENSCIMYHVTGHTASYFGSANQVSGINIGFHNGQHQGTQEWRRKASTMATRGFEMSCTLKHVDQSLFCQQNDGVLSLSHGNTWNDESYHSLQQKANICKYDHLLPSVCKL